MPGELGDVVNRWFDRLPRTTFHVGTRRVPAFRSLGVLGFHVALVVAVLAALRNGTPLATALGLSATAGLSFFAWGHLRRAVTGVETLVLMEYVGVALAAVAGFVWASGEPMRPTLDVFAVAVCPFLAFGRFGCLLVGCCHGVPAGIGVTYGSQHDHLPDRLAHRRLLPVQLIEAGALVAIGAAGFWFLDGPPGRATVWFLAAYAVVRFGLERLRGDHRPALLGLRVAQLTCAVQLAVAMVLAEAWLVPGPPGRADAVAAAALGVAALAAVVLGRADPLTAGHHLDEVWRRIDDLRSAPAGDTPATDHTSLGVTVAATATGDGVLHVSLSHPEHSVAGIGLALSPTPFEHNGVTHLGLADEADEVGEISSYFDPPVGRGVA